MTNQSQDFVFPPLLRVLSQYAGYHRCERNIKTHLVGVPMIVFAIAGLFGLLRFNAFGVSLSVMWILIGLTSVCYLSLELAIGALMALLLILFGLAVQPVLALNPWLAFGIFASIFIAGWALQFLGHHYEGRKPAFVDDLVGFMIGPLFIAAELLFAIGLRADLAAEIERISGPKRP
jgi:uncharacterized membrane protein YGL010W